MYERSSDSGCCFEVESVPDAAKMQALDRDEISLEKVNLNQR